MKKRILSGGESVFEKVTDNLGIYFFRQCDKFQNNTIQIHGDTGETETFASVKQRSIRFAISLRNLGVETDDVVMTCLKMGMDTMIPVISVMFLGARFTAIDPIQPGKDWQHCISLSKPKIIIVDEEQVEKLEKCLAAMDFKPELIILGKSEECKTFHELVRPYPEEETIFKPARVDCHETATILFSSGTTGLPKAIKLSHFGFINQELNFLSFGVHDLKVYLLFSTYYWITSTMALVAVMITGGSRVIVPKFDPENTLRIIQDCKVTSCLVPPSTTRQILAVNDKEDYDTSSLRCYLSGGTTIPPEQLVATRNLFKNAHVYNIYGSTEFGGISTCFNFEKEPRHMDNLHSVGKCVTDYQIKIIDELTGETLGPNQRGEICVKTIYSMIGYLGSDSSNIDKDGFIKMGDRGYYDEDECIYIIGRCRESFKHGVVKVTPHTWEMVLEEHPAVKEAAVVGIPHNSDGFLPAACIILKQGASASARQIEEFFIQKMTTRHELVGGIKFVQHLPKTPSGKLRRNNLHELFMDST